MIEIPRPQFLKRIEQAFEVHPVVALFGPCQYGKSMLSEAYCLKNEKAFPPENHFDLESMMDIQR
jgi:hypothetical protein